MEYRPLRTPQERDALSFLVRSCAFGMKRRKGGMGYEKGKFSVSRALRSALLGIFKLRFNSINFHTPFLSSGYRHVSSSLSPMATLASIFRRCKSSFSCNSYVESHAPGLQYPRCPFHGHFIPKPSRLNLPSLPSNSFALSHLNTLSRLFSAANTSLHHATSLPFLAFVTSKLVTF